MAAEFSYIVTKMDVDVPMEYPHFTKKGVTTIAINSYDPWIEVFIKEFDDGTLKAEYDPENILKVDGEFLPGEIYDLIRKLNIEYKEFGIVQNTFGGGNFAAFRAGKLIPGTQWLDSEQIRYDFSKFLQALDIKNNLISEFHTYWNAEIVYKRNLNG